MRIVLRIIIISKNCFFGLKYRSQFVMLRFYKLREILFTRLLCNLYVAHLNLITLLLTKVCIMVASSKLFSIYF